MTILEPTHHTTDTDDDLDHYCCCNDENTALCGRDVTDNPIVETVHDLCIVCDDLEHTDHCPNGWTCP